jgi:membrane-bound ClpP family serine protease
LPIDSADRIAAPSSYSHEYSHAPGFLEEGDAVLNGVPGMIGESALVTKTISGVAHPGSVRARGEEWLAIPLDPDETIDPGTTVTVVDIERGLLVVFAT